MNLHVVAYPALSSADYELIQASRKLHNSLYSVMEPHFTLIFSVRDVEVDNFIAEVTKHTDEQKAIPFCFRCATVNQDVFSKNYDTFLVPEEGYSSISKLHDRLYSGILKPYHLLEIPYVPHLSIASLQDKNVIKNITDEWNQKDFAIKGIITHLDIINYENRAATTLEKIKLHPL